MDFVAQLALAGPVIIVPDSPDSMAVIEIVEVLSIDDFVIGMICVVAVCAVLALFIRRIEIRRMQGVIVKHEFRISDLIQQVMGYQDAARVSEAKYIDTFRQMQQAQANGGRLREAVESLQQAASIAQNHIADLRADLVAAEGMLSDARSQIRALQHAQE